MNRIRSIVVTREGWYYLFILTFIIGGAIMRQINPLFALAGLMIAPLIFNWRLSMASIKDLHIRRRVPHRISAGEPLIVDMDVSNDKIRLDSWQVRILDEVRWQGQRRSRSESVEVLIPAIPAGDSRRTSYRCHLYRRGKYLIGPARISSGYPVGLLSARAKIGGSTSLLVSPRLGQLQVNWRRTVQSHRSGGQASMNRRGATEGDFYSLRQYRAGDSRRWIHWRTSAKVGQLTVQQFEQTTDRHLTLLIDLWQPNKLDNEDLDAVETAASFAASAVVDLCRAQGGKITVSIAAETPFFHSGVPSRPLLNTVLDFLATARASSDVHPLEHWLETGASGSSGADVLLVSTRPTDHLQDALLSTCTAAQEIPDWTLRIPRISVRDPEFRQWFRIASGTNDRSMAAAKDPNTAKPDSKNKPDSTNSVNADGKHPTDASAPLLDTATGVSRDD